MRKKISFLQIFALTLIFLSAALLSLEAESIFSFGKKSTESTEKPTPKNEEAQFSLFVPGRLCLFGEHSDWAGEYRTTNPAIEKGFCIICGINQGHFATVKKHPTNFIFHICSQKDVCSIHMDESSLLKEATSGTLFSYVAGVAYQMHKKYLVKGLEIHNTESTLPEKGGLGASAAICVLVAKAFNKAYNLNLSTREEMELAYLGEITAQSSCGRMDQACAFGNRPILMSFDGDHIDMTSLDVGKDLFFVIVQSEGAKDTKEILSSLRECYPKAQNSLQESVQKYLGPINKEIVMQAVTAMKEGDAEKLGALMRQAQSEFDRNLIPACPAQLAAPKQHAILNYAPIQQYIYGGKGTGSQGNGCVQFIAKDAKSQKKVIEIIEHTLSIPCLPLTIPAEKCSDK